MNKKRVLVFGTFDGLHNGHHFFLRQAKTRGTELVVGVARDEHVKTLKDKIPQHREGIRLETITNLPFVDQAVLCDKDLGSFDILHVVLPDLIILGYDQRALEESLKVWMTNDGHYIPVFRLNKQS